MRVAQDGHGRRGDGGARLERQLPDPPPAPHAVRSPQAGAPHDPPGSTPAAVVARRRRAERLRAALHARRERLRADTHKNRVYRTVVGAVGTFVVLLGLVLVPLPGPGWLVVFLGLAVLGSEFHSARRVNAFGRRQLHRWTRWLGRRSWGTRIGLGSATALVVAGAAWGYLAWQGLPSWSPEVVTAQLTRVPGL